MHQTDSLNASSIHYHQALVVQTDIAKTDCKRIQHLQLLGCLEILENTFAIGLPSVCKQTAVFSTFLGEDGGLGRWFLPHIISSFDRKSHLCVRINLFLT